MLGPGLVVAANHQGTGVTGYNQGPCSQAVSCPSRTASGLALGVLPSDHQPWTSGWCLEASSCSSTWTYPLSSRRLVTRHISRMCVTVGQ